MQPDTRDVNVNFGMKVYSAAGIAFQGFWILVILRMAHAYWMSLPLLGFSWCSLDEEHCSSGSVSAEAVVSWWFYLYWIHSVAIVLSGVVVAILSVVAKFVVGDFSELESSPKADKVSAYLMLVGILSFTILLLLAIGWIKPIEK